MILRKLGYYLTLNLLDKHYHHYLVLELCETNNSVNLKGVLEDLINCYPAMQEIIVLLQQIRFQNSEYIQ